jgi:hypothetical protein
MPAEKFYPSTTVEGQPSDHLEIAWHRDTPGVVITLEVDGVGAAWFMDRSGINRMVRALRRARDASFGADE